MTSRSSSSRRTSRSSSRLVVGGRVGGRGGGRQGGRGGGRQGGREGGRQQQGGKDCYCSSSTYRTILVPPASAPQQWLPEKRKKLQPTQ